MSINPTLPPSPRPPPTNVRRRRSAEEARADALAAAQRLLLESGPGAVTLKAVGAASAMSHGNLIHHFGSAEDLQSELMNAMVRDLAATVSALIDSRARGELEIGEVVARVFDAYSTGGIGMLAAWLALTGRTKRTEDLSLVIADLVAILEPLQGDTDATRKAREGVRLVTMLAFADSLIGKPLATITGEESADTRGLTLRLLDAIDKGA